MDLSHLRHDASMGDPILQLDVKEQIKTREINAREERNLQRRSEGYERSKFMCEKETAWQQWRVGQSLNEISERSPQMEERLAMEKARIEAAEKGTASGSYKTTKKQGDPSSVSSRSVAGVNLKPSHDRNKQNRPRHPNDRDNNHSNTPERGSGRQADSIRRSEHSIRALAKLDWKQQNRQRDLEKFKEKLYSQNKSVFEQAKVVLKGRSDIDVKNLYSDFENSLPAPPPPRPVRKAADISNSNKPLPRHQIPPPKSSERTTQRSMDSVERKIHPAAEVAEKSAPNPQLAPTVKKPESWAPLAPVEETREPRTQLATVIEKPRLQTQLATITEKPKTRTQHTTAAEKSGGRTHLATISEKSEAHGKDNRNKESKRNKSGKIVGFTTVSAPRNQKGL